MCVCVCVWGGLLKDEMGRWKMRVRVGRVGEMGEMEGGGGGCLKVRCGRWKVCVCVRVGWWWWCLKVRCGRWKVCVCVWGGGGVIKGEMREMEGKWELKGERWKGRERVLRW